MEYIVEFLRTYSMEVICASAIAALISFILVLVNFRRTSKIIRKYKRLMRGADSKNLESMLLQQLEEIQASHTRIKELELACSSINNKMNRCVQHVGVVRYNAFENMGSDQSFSVAMLDENGDGFVLTSLYGRNTSTSFAKPIKAKQSAYPLSDEEKEAIEKALK
ncbi:MAG TPA: DUF4446 family protein [Clostridiales bacterium]|nr:DUF4446 family protein [Clostridiales bacterium]